MLKLIIKKLIQGIIMILLVSAVTFTLLSSAGGDAFSSLSENPQISQQTIENMRRVYGLDRPFAVRYGFWLADTMRGELGESISFRIPVAGLIWTRFLNTAAMALLALLFAAAISLSLGVLSVRYKSKVFTAIIEFVILLTASAPRMVLALFALVFLLWLPLSFSGWLLLIFGAIVLAIPLISVFLAQISEGLSDAMDEDFVRLARAKGLSESYLIIRHALRAALNPFLTIFGFSLGGLLGGSVIVETVLGWPGIGLLMVEAVRTRDVPLVMGIVLVASAAVWVGNTLADILQVVNDKRLRSME